MLNVAIILGSTRPGRNGEAGLYGCGCPAHLCIDPMVRSCAWNSSGKASGVNYLKNQEVNHEG
jgi:hypothetical protein